MGYFGARVLQTAKATGDRASSDHGIRAALVTTRRLQIGSARPGASAIHHVSVARVRLKTEMLALSSPPQLVRLPASHVHTGLVVEK